jgi:hypothetical protein
MVSRRVGGAIEVHGETTEREFPKQKLPIQSMKRKRKKAMKMQEI